MTAAVDYSALAITLENGHKRFDAAVDGMTCAACIGDIEKTLRDLPGLLSVRVNYTNRRIALEWEDETFLLETVFDRLRLKGYQLYPFEIAEQERQENETTKWLLRCLAIAGFAVRSKL